MKKTLLLLFLFLLAMPLSLTAAPCSGEQKQSAREVISLCQEMGARKESHASVSYDFKDPWYSIEYDMQYGLMRSIADAEYCLSDGQITSMFIYYEGHIVASAQGGVIKVHKSTR